MDDYQEEEQEMYNPQLGDIMLLIQDQIRNKAKSESRDKEIEWGLLYLILQQLRDIDRVSLFEIDRELYRTRDEIKFIIKQIRDEFL